VSVTENQTTPHDDAPDAVGGRTENAAEDHPMLQDTDPNVATVRAALADGTANSFKKSLNTCLIIWTVGRSRLPRRRIWIQVTWIAPLVLVTHPYWHVLSGLVHRLH
jgi:hypothetical protein